MKVKFSKGFQKEYRKQSGKIKDSISETIKEVITAKSLDDITDCKKITGLKNIYRIRIGDLRAFFSFHIAVEDGYVYFIALLHRGQAYDKKTHKQLNRLDKPPNKG